MGEVIVIAEYLERKLGPTTQDISKRLADIALQQLVLASEKHRLEHQLQVVRNNLQE
jgi:hypothetical protein